MAGTSKPLQTPAKTKDNNTSGAGGKRSVKPFLVTEISMIRKTRCPQINYEEKDRPGNFKRRLSAEDVIMGRYKYIPVSVATVNEKTIVLRQKKLLSRAKKTGKPIPKILLPPEDSEKGNNLPDVAQQDTDRSVADDENVPSTKAAKNDDSDKQPLSSDNVDDSEIVDSDEVFVKDTLAVKTDNEESDDDLSDNLEESDGFGEYVSYLVDKKRREKKLNSDDFDTDLESTDTDEEKEEEDADVLGTSKPPKINKTLLNYERACSKCQMRPNATFLRQCGRTSLDIRYRMLNYKDAKPIAIALVDDQRTSFLDLSYNPLGPIGVTAVADMLLINDTIIELNLSSTFPETQGIEALAKCLNQNKILRRLYLENNSLQSSDGTIIASLIENSPSLLELHLANNNLGFEGTKAIAKVLSKNTGKLNVLNLSYNNIRTDSAAQLALALKKNTILRSLDVSWNGFGVEGCRALATALEANSTLRDLNLTCNRLGIKSLGFLLKGLIKNKGLHCIRVGMNPLTTEGAKSLISAITSSKASALTELDLKGVPLDEEFFDLKDELTKQKVIRVHYDDNVHLGTSDITRETDGTFLDNFNPVLVMYEYMKKDNLRVIDFFQFFDTRKRDKLSKGDLATGFNILLIPFTQHHVDTIMKTLDANKDGFLSLDEMVKGYTKSDKIVKKRRIKASKMKTTDEGLENLWVYLKSLIVKRKEENVKKNAAQSQARRDSMFPGRRGSIMPGGSDGRRGSIMPGGSDGRRGSIMPGSEGRRGSLLPGSDGRRGSLLPGSGGRRGSLLPGSGAGKGSLVLPVSDSRKGSIPSGSESWQTRRGSESDGSRRGSLLSVSEAKTEEGRKSRRVSQTRLSDVIREDSVS